MSLIQQIRDRAAWIIFGAIAISLLAFIAQDYFSNQGGGAGLSGGSTLGKVNGESIGHDAFEQKVSFYEQMNNGQYQRNQLIPQVWDFLVNQTIMNQETEKLGIEVNSNELTDMLFGNNPPQFMQQFFTDPNTGIYDVNKAKQSIANLKTRSNDPQVQTFVEAYIEPAILQTKAEKYQSLITGGVYVPKWMAEKLNADANAVAKASYVNVPYSTIADSTIKVSAEEMTAYIQKHAPLFKRDEETRTLSYVSFSGTATAADSAAVRTNLEQLKPEFAASTDEPGFLNSKGSDLPYYNGLIAGKEIKQAIKDTLFTVGTGHVYGPYIDGNNYVIAKMVAKQVIPDSVKVRHILVATRQQDPNSGQFVAVLDDSAALKRLDSAIAMVKSGGSFDSAVIKYSDDGGSKNMGGVYDYFASGKMDAAFNNFAFTGHTGETKTVQTFYGYHYVEILGQKGSESAYKIAYLTKPIVASAETDNTVSNAASQFAASSQNQKDFDANAKKQNLIVLTSTEFRQNDFSINSLGESRELVRWAYDHKPGEVSSPFNINDNYVVAMLTGISPKGLASAAAVQQTVEPQVLNEKKAKIIEQQFKGTTLEQIASATKQQVQTADSINFSAFIVPMLGSEPKFMGAAFNKQLLNKISAPIAGNSGVYVVRSEGVFGSAALGQTADLQKQQLEQMLKQQASQSITALRKSADVEDNRAKFY